MFIWTTSVNRRWSDTMSITGQTDRQTDGRWNLTYVAHVECEGEKHSSMLEMWQFEESHESLRSSKLNNNCSAGCHSGGHKHQVFLLPPLPLPPFVVLSSSFTLPPGFSLFRSWFFSSDLRLSFPSYLCSGAKSRPLTPPTWTPTRQVGSEVTESTLTQDAWTSQPLPLLQTTSKWDSQTHMHQSAPPPPGGSTHTNTHKNKQTDTHTHYWEIM